MPNLETLLNVENEVNAVLNELGIPEKLSEMDDFMNQNDLKVDITTNENAVTTGLVTYTCTVKDANNNALPNRVVEWYEGTTLVGIDATDSNGISTFSRQVATGSIYNVHAVVKGTHAGDDLRMFVKDRNNLFSINAWSGGELNGTLTRETEYYAPSAQLVVSPDWAYIGDKSIKCSFGSWLRFIAPVTANDVGKTATLKAKCYVPSGSLEADLMTDSHVASSVNIPTTSSGTHYAEVLLTTTIPADTNQLVLNLRNFEGGEFVYVDNLELYITV